MAANHRDLFDIDHNLHIVQKIELNPNDYIDNKDVLAIVHDNRMNSNSYSIVDICKLNVEYR